jgi:hypothetical protein
MIRRENVSSVQRGLVVRPATRIRIGFLFRFAICAIAFASAVGAQQPQAPTDPSAVLTMQQNQTAQLAATWLHSGDPRLQAWGAYVVLRDKHKELIPDLLALANAYEITGLPVLSPHRAQHDAMLAILDTLIQLNPRIPADESKRLYSEFPAQSMILLSRAWINPDSLDSSNKILLELFRTEHSQLEWLAAGNILGERKAEGFAAAVLGNVTVHLNLQVTGLIGHMHGMASSCSEDFFPEKPDDRAGWPEIGTYALTEARPDATLLVNGADPSYYLRKVSRLYGFNSHEGAECRIITAESWDRLREHYVTRLLGASEDDPPLRVSLHQTIIWENDQAYLAYLRTAVRQEQEAFAEVVQRFKNIHLLSDVEAAAAKPHVEITIVDDREDRSASLPRAENLGENIIVKM